MPEFIRFLPDKAGAAARAVAAGLKQGPAIVPILGGYCVIADRPDPVRAVFGRAHRLIASLDTVAAELAGAGELRAAAVRLLHGPVVGVFSADREQGGVALASEQPWQSVVNRAGGVLWLGVPDDAAEPGELADDLGRRLSVAVTLDDDVGPGPTLLDFLARPVSVDRRGKRAILDVEAGLGSGVRLGSGLAFSVLVVCTGNSCRSPMAAGILARLLTGERAFVYSAGTDAPVGAPATPSAVVAVRDLEVDLSVHRARQLDPRMVADADLVLVMDRYHQQRVLEMLPEAAGRTRLLLGFSGGGHDEVDDPVGRPLETYRRTVDVMMPALEQVAREVRQRLERK